MRLKYFAAVMASLILSSALGRADIAPEMILRSERPLNKETPLKWIDQDGIYTRNEHFFTRSHLALIPKLNAKTWRLELKGQGLSRPLIFSMAELKKRFRTVEFAALAYCAGNRRGLIEPRVPGVQWNVGAMGNARWRGVRLADVLKSAGLKPEAIEVVFDGADQPVWSKTPDFKKSLPIKKALDPNTLIAFEMNGQPLAQQHGFPARLVVPGWAATYWIKYLVSIEVVTASFDGFWMKTAYRVPKGVFPGEPFESQEQSEKSPVTSIAVNSVVTNVTGGQRVQRGHDLTLRGLAWDGGSGVERVEVSVDEGKTWKSATLDQDYGVFSWRKFNFIQRWKEVGEKSVMVRATNQRGESQRTSLIPNPGGYHHNLIQRLKVVVE